MPKLLLKFGAAVIKEIAIEKTPLNIGRKPDNDIVIDNPAVSSHHCKIASYGNTFFIEDVGSTNGTFVNGKKIIKAGLRNNDVIGVAKHTIVFVDLSVSAQANDQPAQSCAQAAGQSASQPQKEAQHGQTTPPASHEEIAGLKPMTGILQVIDGFVDKSEYEMTALSTYIGKSERAGIPIKGSGMFGSVPEVAAMIAKRPDGYFLVQLKEGYTKVNGNVVSGKEPLKDGDLIEIGATKFRFQLKA